MGNDLANRARTAVQRPAAAGNGSPTLAKLIDNLRPEIARALPAHMNADRIARIALTLIRQNPKLRECTPESFLGALMTASQLGLEPGPLGEAYLVPYGREVTFIPGYRGLLKLAWQSGQLKTFDANVVHDGDQFDYELGLDPFLKHKPTRGEAGKPTEVYAVATFLNGGSAFRVLSVNFVEGIRARSRASRNGPWVTDWDAMAAKTAVKQLVKFLPLSTELQQLARAVQLDGTTRTDINTPIDEAVTTFVDADENPGMIEPPVTPEETPADDVEAPLAEGDQ